jgi:acetylornithine deacetylase/succinyl-diaminopimelate desuccinylase-like protein
VDHLASMERMAGKNRWTKLRMHRLTILLLFFGCLLWGQVDPYVTAARSYRQAHELEVVKEFISLLAIPNIAADPASLRKNAESVRALLNTRGIRTRFLEHEGVPPVVYGEFPVKGASRTLTFYAHYDGSPLNAKEWLKPPFEPLLRSAAIERDGQVIALPHPGRPFDPEWRIYARSTGDDKAPLIAMMTALDALKASGKHPSANLKFVIEGEEEAGSVHLEQILRENKDILASDVWLICDGPVHQSRAAQIAFGARGVVTATLTVYGARRELHSGHYGNWSPNPALLLAQLLASMKDSDGNVLVSGFQDGMEPLGAVERQAIADMPNTDPELKKELWLGRTEGGNSSLAELINLPSLNIRGITSGRTDAASNVIPAIATAALDMRLVKGVTHENAISSLRRHIANQGYFVVDAVPDAATLMSHPRVLYMKIDEFAYDAVRTPMDLPIAKAVRAAAERARKPVIALPTMGGSLPLIMIERQLNVHTIVVPMANHDDNQHSLNENIRLQNLWEGIDLMAAMMSMQ